MQPKLKEYTLVCFIKNPVKGQVKTRLAKEVGEEEALQIYHRLLRYTKEVLDQVDGCKKLYFSSAIPSLSYWQQGDYDAEIQTGEDLGQRMSQAFYKELTMAKKVVLIGSDCAEITPRHLKEALSVLDEEDAVFGPAKDGGYYLIGLKKYIPGLFENMPWSQKGLLEKSLDYLQKNEYRYKLLEKLSDVDHKEDWQRVQWK